MESMDGFWCPSHIAFFVQLFFVSILAFYCFFFFSSYFSFSFPILLLLLFSLLFVSFSTSVQSLCSHTPAHLLSVWCALSLETVANPFSPCLSMSLLLLFHFLLPSCRSAAVFKE